MSTERTVKHHFLTYADHKFVHSKRRILKEAEDFGFDKVWSFGPEDLSEEFKEKTKEVLTQSRGAGYWIWKSYCLKTVLDSADLNDIIVYCDAGTSVRKEFKHMYLEYLELLNKSDHKILSFALDHRNNKWTKRDCFDFFGIKPEDPLYSKEQLHATVIIFIKTQSTIDLINEYYSIATEHPKLFDDSTVEKNYPDFIDHRHDQSVFSLLRYLRGSVLIDTSYDSLFKTGPFLVQYSRN